MISELLMEADIDDIVFFAVVDVDGEIAFKAGEFGLDNFSSDVVKLMSRYDLKKVFVEAESIKMLVSNIGSYYVVLASEREQNLGFLATVLEKKLEEIRNI